MGSQLSQQLVSITFGMFRPEAPHSSSQATRLRGGTIFPGWPLAGSRRGIA
jgi:hypothetical protein